MIVNQLDLINPEVEMLEVVLLDQVLMLHREVVLVWILKPNLLPVPECQEPVKYQRHQSIKKLQFKADNSINSP